MILKKELNGIAATLKKAKPRCGARDMFIWERLCTDVAKVCAESNPRFKMKFFYEACDCEHKYYLNK